MNTDNTFDNDRALDSALRQWTVKDPLPARFQEQVWRRIADAEAPPQPFWLAALSRLLGVVLPRPKFAFVYLSILLVAGVVTGSVSAQIRTHRLNAELSQRYVQLIDPNRAGPSAP